MSETSYNNWPRLAFFAAVVATFLTEIISPRYGSDSPFGTLGSGSLFRNFQRLTTYLPLVALIPMAYNRIAKQGNRQNKSNQGAIWLPYLTVWFLLAVLLPDASSDWEPWYSAGVAAGLALFTFRNEALRPGDIKFVTRFLTAASLILGITFHGRFFAPYVVWPGGWFEGADRLQGLFPHPNTLGWVAAVAIFIEFTGDKRPKGMWLGIALVDLVLSGSRSASIALVLAGVTYFLVTQRRAGGSRLYFVFVATATAALLAYFEIVAVQRDLNGLNGRTVDWQIAQELILRSPLVGLGPLQSLSSNAPYVHNQVLQTSLEMGLVGLVVLVSHVFGLFQFWAKNGFRPATLAAIVMWISMFLSENLLRFASVGFLIQVILFQAALHSTAKINFAENGSRRMVTA